MLLRVSTSPGRPPATIHVGPGQTLSFGSGQGVAVDLVLDYPGLSRRAGYIGMFDDGRVSITCCQTGGAIEVRRANGLTANRLSTGEACVVSPADYSVEVVGIAGPSLVIELRNEASPISARIPPAIPVVTMPLLSPRAVLTPGPGQEWQTILALACVLARRSPRPDGWAAPSTKHLASAVTAWFNVAPSDKWLSDRLDAALKNLNLPRDGSDKLPRLVARALAGRLLTDALLDEVEQRLSANAK